MLRLFYLHSFSYNFALWHPVLAVLQPSNTHVKSFTCVRQSSFRGCCSRDGANASRCHMPALLIVGWCPRDLASNMSLKFCNGGSKIKFSQNSECCIPFCGATREANRTLPFYTFPSDATLWVCCLHSGACRAKKMSIRRVNDFGPSDDWIVLHNSLPITNLWGDFTSSALWVGVNPYHKSY